MAERGSTGALLAGAAACLVLMQTALAATVKRKPFDLDDITSGEFSPEEFDFEWISGTEILYKNDSEVVAMDVSSMKSRVLVPKEVYSSLQANVSLLSADERYVLLGYDVAKVFRHSAIARYVAYNIAKNTTTQIAGGERLQFVDWSPEGNALAYVLQNDLYYVPEVGGQPVRITDDGAPDVIYNGVANELTDESLSAEESLNKEGAIWWSPSGSRLVLARYDDSAVQSSSLLRYGQPGLLKGQYATVVSFRYSKPGTPNSRVTLKLATLPAAGEASVTVQQLVGPTDVLGKECSPEDVSWADDNTLMVSWKNRVSNVRQFVSYNTESDTKRMHGRQGVKMAQPSGWLDPQVSYFREGNSSTFITIDWVPQSGGASFPHVVAVTGKSTRAVTSGALAVTEIYGWADNGTVYYQATEEGEPSRRQVFAVEEGGSPRCLSCDVISPEGNACLRASASFSHDLSWFWLTCLGPDPPVMTTHPTADPDSDVLQWVDNEDLRTQLLGKQQPRQLDDWVEVGGGLRAQVRLWLPPGLDPRTSEKRPAIVYVYAGPGSQQVDDSYAVDLNSYFTTSRRYVYIVIDGRGSGGRDNRTLFAVYRRLGSVEVEDQINVTKRLTEKYGFIDASRVGIWGWSYGGYATAMALAQDEEDVFRCGVSVAPVSSWIYYSSQYTEVYMGLPTPEDNEVGYNASDVTRLAERFQNKTFFLIHGTADDNVHYQHSMMLARALEDAGVIFRQQSYPDQDHTVADLSTHLYRSVDEFFAECFEDQQPASSSPAKTASRLLPVLLLLCTAAFS
ncbi:venom dipeptidyl peptidase 4-like [Schistocerca gregaria]|uniref:venom dipeptidyl peptidase 4-like n=1 Tax=Schistocerca gregaria TaxID=7010 RepID=UPI00211E342D|nr:venom dipeptidyl peptidase 4-like [Schistocerca gregaria]